MYFANYVKYELNIYVNYVECKLFFEQHSEQSEQH